MVELAAGTPHLDKTIADLRDLRRRLREARHLAREARDDILLRLAND